MKTRYALVHGAEPEGWHLVSQNIGANHYDSVDAAIQMLTALGPELQRKLKLHTLAVIAVQCYDHGDAVGTVFDKSENPPLYRWWPVDIQKGTHARE